MKEYISFFFFFENYKPIEQGIFLCFKQDAYMIAVTLNEWKTNLELPTGETVILHNPKVLSKNQFLK